MAWHIRDLQSLPILGNEYEITAYIAAPDDSSRGVVHGIPPGSPISELIDSLHAPGYEILTAQMLVKTSTALITCRKAGAQRRHLRTRDASGVESPLCHVLVRKEATIISEFYKMVHAR